MRHARAVALVFAATLLAACGRPLLSAEVEIPEVRVTEPGQQFDPPFASTINPCTALPIDCRATVTQDVQLDLGDDVPFLDEEGVEVELRLKEMALHFGGGSSAGLQSLRVLLVEAGGGATLLGSYTKPAGSAAPTDVVMAMNSDVNLADYLNDGVVAMRVQLEYDGDDGVPSGGEPLTVDVTVAFSIKTTVEYTKL